MGWSVRRTDARTLRGLALASLAVLLFLPAAPVAGQAAAAEGNSPRQQIRDLEARRFAAMVRADGAELGRLLADDLTYGHSSGQLDTKASLLAALASGKLRYESLVPGDETVRIYADTAVGTGEVAVRAQAGDQKLDATLRFTDVWVQQDGRWRLVAWQSTRVPAPPVAPAKKDG